MKKRILALTIAIISAVSAMGLCSCGEKETAGDEVAQSAIPAQPASPITSESETDAQTSAEETSEVTEETEQSESESQESQEQAGVSPQAALDSVSSYRTNMSDRGTPIDENLNFEFSVADAQDNTDDPKMSPEETVKSLVKQALGESGNGCTAYVGISGDTLFVQVKDADGNISQAPAASGEITWGTLAQ